MLDYKVLMIDPGTGKASEKTLRNVTGAIEAGLTIHEEEASWDYPPLSKHNPLFIGIGPFAGGPLFGTHRVIAVFRSPISYGIHISTMGGAAYAFMRTGLHGIVIRGSSSEPAIIRVLGGPSGLEVDVEYLEWKDLEEIYKSKPGGTRALHRYIARLLGEKAVKYKPRILLVGPGALTTRFGGLFSWVPDSSGGPGQVVDSASRGGAGSVLAQGHGVVAIVVGGVASSPNPVGRKLVETASRLLGGNFYKALEKATVKYRYDSKLGTGGTFGVNYVHYRELVPALAYNTIYYSPGVRLALHEKIMRSFWKPFQEWVFLSGTGRYWRTCGEPCSVVCKKLWRGVKIDYEPAHAMGPMIGVITLEDSARLVEKLDDYGLDAIEAGHMVAWLFDAINKGILEPDEIGLSTKPVFDPVALDEAGSHGNALLASKIIDMVASRKGEHTSLIALEGLREAARILDELYETRISKTGWSFRDVLVYSAFGANGYFTPNYYWSPGVIAPLYIQGRYWTNYSPSYTDPEDYAVHSYNRAIAELAIDNAGICRFHRKWAERILDDLHREVYGFNEGIYERAKKTYRRIALYQLRAGAEPQPWESRKTMDIVATMAAEIKVPGWEGIIGNYEAIRDWWIRFYSKIKELVGG